MPPLKGPMSWYMAFNSELLRGRGWRPMIWRTCDRARMRMPSPCKVTRHVLFEKPRHAALHCVRFAGSRSCHYPDPIACRRRNIVGHPVLIEVLVPRHSLLPQYVEAAGCGGGTV